MKIPAPLVASLLCLAAPHLRALDGAEAADFPNSINAPGIGGFICPLGIGTQIISGGLLAAEQPGDTADYFWVTVPYGLRISEVRKQTSGVPGKLQISSFNHESTGGFGVAIYTGRPALGGTPFPLPAGTYEASVLAGTAGTAGSMTFAVEEDPDYTVTATDTTLTVTDLKGNSDVLSITQPAAEQIIFSAAGRIFSVNGGPATVGSSGALALGGVTSTTVNTGKGNDTINVGEFTSVLRSLTLNGGMGDDTVNFDGSFDVAGDGLDVNLQNDDPAPGVDSVNLGFGVRIRNTGAGFGIRIRCSRSVHLARQASLESTTSAWISIDANQQAVPTPGNFSGVTVDGATVLGWGHISGTGGDDPGGNQHGVRVINGGKVLLRATPRYSAVNGTGGAGSGSRNLGVEVSGVGSTIMGDTDTIAHGTGGSRGSGSCSGILISGGGQIRATDSGATVRAEGGGVSGGDANHGIEISGAGSRISSAIGLVGISGTSGPGLSAGLSFTDASIVAAEGDDGRIDLICDRFSVDTTSRILATGAHSSVRIRPLRSYGTLIDLGGPDAVGTPTTLHTLGISAGELDRFFTPELNIYCPRIEISTSISPADVENLILKGSVRPIHPGVDVSMNGAGMVKMPYALDVTIAGRIPDADYEKLTVSGGLSIAGTLFVRSQIAGEAGNSFILVDNDGDDPIDGTFDEVPEGGLIWWPGSSSVVGRITYTGGTGNDVVLTLEAADPGFLIVTNTRDDGPGSLRAALDYAARAGGQDTVTFAPALSGRTITLTRPLIFADTFPVAVDASELPHGITIHSSQIENFGYFLFFGYGPSKLRGLNISGGSQPEGPYGGSLLNVGDLTLDDCTFTDNSAESGGAIHNYHDGTLKMNRCTLTGNTGAYGGALYNAGAATLTHCTFSGNAVSHEGGAIYNASGFPVILDHCLIAANPAGGDPAGNIYGDVTASPDTLITGSAAGLAPLGDYGGPTATMALLPGSPAREAAAGSPATRDQRGLPMVGTPDLGAYEAGTPANCAAWLWESLPSEAGHEPGADFDGDGATNEAEWNALTNAADAASVFRLTTSLSGGDVLLHFPTVSGRNYTLWQSDTLGPDSWTQTPLPAVAGDGSVKTFTLPSPAAAVPERFHRVQAGP